MASGSHEELGHQDEVAKGEDIEGMIVSSGMGPPSGKSESKGKDNHMPRYKTRLFAAEYAIQLAIYFCSSFSWICQSSTLHVCFVTCICC